MISVTFHFNKANNLPDGFKIKGHANYAEAGEPDIICAAITALSTGTIGALQDIVKVPLTYVAEEGNISCRVDVTEIDSEKAHDINLLIMSLRLAIKQIQIVYGDEFVKIM